ncbi:MAG: hypothetical protein RR334_02760, partial [Clostridia bacterium]
AMNWNVNIYMEGVDTHFSKAFLQYQFYWCKVGWTDRCSTSTSDMTWYKGDNKTEYSFAYKNISTKQKYIDLRVDVEQIPDNVVIYPSNWKGYIEGGNWKAYLGQGLMNKEDFKINPNNGYHFNRVFLYDNNNVEKTIINKDLSNKDYTFSYVTGGAQTNAYAEFLPNSNTINYKDGNGFFIRQQTNTFYDRSDGKVMVSGTSTPYGYTFTGWKSSATGTVYQDGSECTELNLNNKDKDGNIIDNNGKEIDLIAQWTPNKRNLNIIQKTSGIKNYGIVVDEKHAILGAKLINYFDSAVVSRQSEFSWSYPFGWTVPCKDIVFNPYANGFIKNLEVEVMDGKKVGKDNLPIHGKVEYEFTYNNFIYYYKVVKSTVDSIPVNLSSQIVGTANSNLIYCKTFDGIQQQLCLRMQNISPTWKVDKDANITATWGVMLTVSPTADKVHEDISSAKVINCSDIKNNQLIIKNYLC